MAHWTEKRRACARLGEALRALGWTLLGWKDDKSDAMTDYWDPASWAGVATLGDAVVCVDAGTYTVERHSGKTEEVWGFEDAGPCAACGETGAAPGTWTLTAARADPLRFHAENDPPGTRSMLPRVVSPILFRDDGRLKCRTCHGNGRLKVHRARPGATWPTFQPNRKGTSWHVERGGRILASGSGVFSALRAPRNAGPFKGNAAERASQSARFAALAERITAAARRGEAPALEAAAPVAAGDGFTVRESAVTAGYVEVVFEAKPAADVRDELKAARFRWSGRSGCWYGRADALPARFLEPSAPEAD